MKLSITQEKLNEAAAHGIITPEQAAALYEFLQKSPVTDQPDPKTQSSRMSNFLFYFGALIVISAMTWFMTEAWSKFGHGTVLFITLVYATIFIGASIATRKYSNTLSGLLIVMTVCLTPLAVYNFQQLTGLWPYKYPGSYTSFYVYIKSGWFTMEVATIVAGLVSLRYARIPFAMAPVAFVLWYLSMDIVPILYGPDYNWHMRKIISVYFGLAMLIVAFFADRRTGIDYAKWLYIFGAITFWTGLTSLNSNSELTKLLYCLLNIFMMFVGILLERRVFLIFGGLGVFTYIGHLAWQIFRGSLLFPVALSAVGLAVLFLGWQYHRKEEEVILFVRRITPDIVIKMLPQNR